MFRHVIKKHKGASIVEYTLLAAFLSAIAIIAVRNIGDDARHTNENANRAVIHTQARVREAIDRKNEINQDGRAGRYEIRR